MVSFCVRNWFALLGEMGRVLSAVLSLEGRALLLPWVKHSLMAGPFRGRACSV